MEGKPIFLETFGYSPQLKLLDFLVIHSNFDYPLTDIANHSGIGYSTLKKMWPSIVDSEIVEHTRNIGHAKLYTLNKKNPFIKEFIKFYWKVVFGKAGI